MRKYLVIIIGSLLLCSAAGAQQLQTGAISGYVTNESGEALPGVIVPATADVLPSGRSTVTGTDGTYRFPSLPPGNYDVTYSMPGLLPPRRSSSR